MLRAKLTDRAFSFMQSVLKEYPHDYQSIKEQLTDYFHEDENTDFFLKKFNKTIRKPGEKIVDYAHRLQDRFKRAYPTSCNEPSFAIILKQKFIEGLDSNLQFKVKYKEFKTYNELVAATRVYALRMEATDKDQDKRDFVRAVDQPIDSEIIELKKMLLEQKEIVKSAVAHVHQGDKRQEKQTTSQDDIKSVLSELTRAVKELQLNRKDNIQSFKPRNDQARKQVSFQEQNGYHEQNGYQKQNGYQNKMATKERTIDLLNGIITPTNVLTNHQIGLLNIDLKLTIIIDLIRPLFALFANIKDTTYRNVESKNSNW